MMRSRLEVLALAPAMVLLASCSPPPRASLMILNASGERLSFATCKSETITLEPGGSAELHDVYAAFNPDIDRSCYAKQTLVMRRDGGGQWAYAGWEKRGVGAPKDRRPAMWDFAPENREGFLLEHHYTVKIEAGGGIRMGRHAGAGLEFPEEQPRGFPLVPLRESNVVIQ